MFILFRWYFCVFIDFNWVFIVFGVSILMIMLGRG